MDSVTQAILGASVGEAVAGRKIGRAAAVTGAIIGTLPDLDILMTPFFDELQKISIHRGYSHSLIMSFLSAFLLAYLLSKLRWTRLVSYRRLWLLAFLCWFTHILLDAFTTYGTQLLLPFTDWRVSFDSITIVDPLYTLPLMAGVGFSLWKYKPPHAMRSLPNNIGILVSSMYLLITLANKEHIEYVFARQLQSQGIPYYHLLTVPVKVANYEWYGVARDDQFLHMGKYSEWSKNEIEFHSFPINDHLLDDIDPRMADRLKWFAQGFYTVAEKDGAIRVYNMQCDMQGVRQYGDYKAPTAFYYQVDLNKDGTYELSSGMHPREGSRMSERSANHVDYRE